MNYHFKSDTNEPKYIQLYKQLVRDIVRGIYPLESKMPSKRIISQETGLSLITIEHALDLLLDEGYIEARERSGYFVTYKEADFQRTEVPSRDFKDNYGIEIPKNENSFPYSVLAKTMRKVIADYDERLLTKSPNNGIAELRNEICKYLGRSRGISVSPAQIIIGSGAEYLYTICAQLLGKEKIFAIENPSYDKIRKVYETLGIAVDMLDLGKNGIHISELKRTPAKVLHVTPFNSFPSGISVDISKKKEYLMWARERQGVIIEDNYDSELTVSSKAEDTLYSLSEDSNVIYINTFSNTIAPSIRIGYMILPNGLLEEYNEKLGFYSCTVPIFEQLVLAELLRSGNFERHINRVRRRKRKQ